MVNMKKISMIALTIIDIFNIYDSIDYTDTWGEFL